MLQINMDDVIAVLNLISPYLIGFGVVLVLAIAATFLARKQIAPKKFLIRAQSWIAVFVSLVLVVNLMLFGPLSTMVTLATNRKTIGDDTIRQAIELAERITGEGIVMLENGNGFLPLTDQNIKLNVFGWSASNPIFGGSGSGALSTMHEFVGLVDGLENSGFEINKELLDFYNNYRADRPSVGLFEQDWTLPEPPVDRYSNELLGNALAFSDIAMVVISRTGAEGPDLPLNVSQVNYDMNYNSTAYADYNPGDHYLQLSQSERNMIEMVAENFDNIILVYNAANGFELGFVEEFEQIKSVLWVPGPGHKGFNALGEIISGKINPSGRTTDTFVYDLSATPTFNNFGNFEYQNMDAFVADSSFTDGRVTFINYVEGIYAGYRFFETASAEGIIDYEKTVQYPFGYGLSYTNFTQEMGSVQRDAGGGISVDVTVTNTGNAAGKEVVQIYYTPPYSNGGIEKAEVNLIAFGKTGMIEPGGSERLTLTFREEDMASFDTYGTGAWVLESGDYIISLRSDSNTVIDQEVMPVNTTIIYDERNPRSTDKVSATVQFDFAEGTVEYLSRQDKFANFARVTAPPANFDMDEKSRTAFYNDTNWNPENFSDPNAVMPVVGATNGIMLLQMRGLDYDDAAWEPFLDQLTINDMVNLVALGGYSTTPIPSLGKVQTIDLDGPAAINNNFTNVGSVGMPVAVMVANTFNPELSREFGSMMGRMADEMGVSGWYAPGINLHRSAFAGRNFEYYSEDPVLTGKVATKIVEGALEDFGVYAYVKHFALNDQEENRWRMLTTWSSEQAIREIYLPPFEMTVKEGGASAIMSAYNWIGNEWAGSSNALLNTVLRDEWGFRGMVLTDYFAGFGFMDADRMIRNGGDLALITYDNRGNFLDDRTSETAVYHMRRAAKNIMYTTVNSRAYADGNNEDGITFDIANARSAEVASTGSLFQWQIITIVITGILLVGVLALEVLVLRKYKKKKQNA